VLTLENDGVDRDLSEGPEWPGTELGEVEYELLRAEWDARQR
jgi:hypothetical protein